MLKYIGIFFIFLGALVALSVLYINSNVSKNTRTFSEYTLLSLSWENYKKQFINVDGRVINTSGDDVTTSEGQSYALLRCVWIDDKPTFDLVWKWTSENLKRPNDNLFGWRWGKLDDGSYGFLTNGADNSASDSDSDIALALILASRRWKDDSYKEKAMPIINDIWNIETAQVQDKRYLIAGNWAQDNKQIVINPSYFAPYAWRIFAQIDTDHDWKSLVDPAYELLQKAGQDKLDMGEGVGLPPDWVSMDKEGILHNSSRPNGFTTNYSYDALRVPWRIYVDYIFNNDLKAKDYLVTSFVYLRDQFKNDGKLVNSYDHAGQKLSQGESPAMYAGSLGAFLAADPDLAKKVYEEKIIKLYSNDQNGFNQQLTYYDQNWLWFGAALYSGKILDFH